MLRRLMLAVSLVTAVGVMGCKPRQSAFTPPPPPEVQVSRPIVRTLPQTLEFTGLTSGTQQVDVRARVRGFIQSRTIKGGEKVKAGDTLFVIDPRPFQAAVQQAEAEVAQNDAKLRLAQITLDRKQQSAAGQAISQFELDQAVADRDAAKATHELSQAKLEIARDDLRHTNVTAPFDGRIDINVANVGELVGDASTKPLCRIINDAVIYVEFNVPERVVLATRAQYQNRRPGEEGRPAIPVYVGFANDPDGVYPFEGHYESSDAGFDPNTGTTQVRAIFENTDGRIVAGAFARILSVTGEESVTLVPDAAVSVDQSGRYVLTVNDKDIVERTPVTVDGIVDQMRKITSPLPINTRVIVNGLQRARPGVAVKATEVPMREPKLQLGFATTRPTTQPATQPTTQATTPPTTNPVQKAE